MQFVISPFLHHFLAKEREVRIYLGSLENGVCSESESLCVTRSVAAVLEAFAKPASIEEVERILPEHEVREVFAELKAKKLVVRWTDGSLARDRKVCDTVLTKLENYYCSTLEAIDAGLQGQGAVDHIGTTDRCNMRCIMCPRSNTKRPRKATDMSLDLFRSVLDQLPAGNNGVLVRLWHFGEPLLDPYLEARATILHERGIEWALSINPVNIAMERMKKILAAKPTAMVVSLDANTARTYEQRRGGKFSNALGRLYDLIEYKRKLGSETKIIVQYILMDELDSEVEGFTERWREVKEVEWLVRMFQCLPGASLGHQRYSIEQTVCLEMWRLPYVVATDGALLACPVDYDHDHVVGYLKDTSLRDILWNKSGRARRKNHFEALISSSGELCHRCGQRNVVNELIRRYVTSDHALYRKHGRKLSSDGALVL